MKKISIVLLAVCFALSANVFAAGKKHHAKKHAAKPVATAPAEAPAK